MPVPSISQVQPGAAVSIVLKADQRTGREVQGQVQDVLTRGNHPRGIKVRLSDGRIGRVQRMSTALPSQAASQESAGDSLSFGQSVSYTTQSGNLSLRSEGGQPGSAQRPRHRDVRMDEQSERPAESIDLFAYTKPAKQRKGRKQTDHPASNTEDPVVVSCPVCGKFEGDEAAVAHHVESHFNE